MLDFRDDYDGFFFPFFFYFKDESVDMRDYGRVLRGAFLEQLLYARETLRNVTAHRCGSAGVEGTHRELCSRLADSLRRDRSHRFAEINQLILAEIKPVTHRADSVSGLAY